MCSPFCKIITPDGSNPSISSDSFRNLNIFQFPKYSMSRSKKLLAINRVYITIIRGYILLNPFPKKGTASSIFPILCTEIRPYYNLSNLINSEGEREKERSSIMQ
jgi:hypothetical protein